MFNAFVMKKYAVLLALPSIVATAVVLGGMYYGLFGALGFLVGGLLIAVVGGIFLLKNPFSDMLEGKGILVFDINSTGIIRPFIVKVLPPYIKGKVGSVLVEDVYDRQAVFHLAKPEKAGSVDQARDGGITININEEELNRGRFGLFHYPVLLYNSQLGSIVTKDFFSDQEKSVFAEHITLHLNRKLEDLDMHLRDFGRYVVELLKPKGEGFLAGKWMWIIIIGGVIIMAVIFGPSIIEAVRGAAPAAASGVSEAVKSGATIVPTG